MSIDGLYLKSKKKIVRFIDTVAKLSEVDGKWCTPKERLKALKHKRYVLETASRINKKFEKTFKKLSQFDWG